MRRKCKMCSTELKIEPIETPSGPASKLACPKCGRTEYVRTSERGKGRMKARKASKPPKMDIWGSRKKTSTGAEIIRSFVKDGRKMLEIRCTERGCKRTRIIHVQDQFQVRRCVECQKEHRNAIRRKGATNGRKARTKRTAA